MLVRVVVIGCRGTRMSVDFTVIKDLAGLRELEPAWRELAQLGGSGALFRGPDWLMPWWHAYHQVLHAEPVVLVGRAGDELVCIAPLYLRTNKLPLVEVRELRLFGDAGPRPPALDIIVRPGWEDKAGTQLARELVDLGKSWDVIDLEPLADPSRTRANLIARLGSAGFMVESSPTAGGARRLALSLLRPEVDAASSSGDSLVTVYADDPVSIRKGMSALRRLSRLEWADRDEQSPLADAEAVGLLEEVATTQGKLGRARLALHADSSGEAVAAALVVDDGERAVVLALAVDPEHVARGAAARLIAVEAAAAAARGRVALDVVTGAAEYPLPPLPMSRQGALAVRIWNATRGASVSRTYEGVRRRARAVRETPGVAASQARAAWARIRSAAQEVAGYQRMHLYRGQLWTRGIEPTAGLVLARFTEADFDALPPQAKADISEQLVLDEAQARASWGRGDLALLARLHDRPAGIAWAARGPVEVPELARTLSLSKYEAYIHDVYVAGAARGRAVAPVMLEQLARELRDLDVFRAWALIGADNQGSVRAFEKASYTAVCDVIYARMASVNRIVLRPPDPEAKELFGIV